MLSQLYNTDTIVIKLNSNNQYTLESMTLQYIPLSMLQSEVIHLNLS